MPDTGVYWILKRYLGDRVPDRPRGDEIMMKCPFHGGGNEKKPAFQISLVTGASRCYVCKRGRVEGKKGWSLYDLLLEIGVDAEEAKAALEAANLWSGGGDPMDQTPLGVRKIDLDKATPSRRSAPTLPEYVLAAYSSTCPVDLVQAGFKATTLFEHEIGYDRIHRRWTYPIRDCQGRIVAIVGRKRDDEEGERYKTYREELGDLCPKHEEIVLVHHHLWNLHRFYEASCRGAVLPYLVIVEGVKKALWIIQNGWEYVVALNGSGFTEEQANLIRGMNIEAIFILTDDDPAGQRCKAQIHSMLDGAYRLIDPEYPEGKTQPDVLLMAELAKMLSKRRTVRWSIRA